MSNSPLSPLSAKRLLFLGLGLAVFALDQLSKYPFRTSWPLGQSQPVLPFLSFTYVRNPGALFGIFPNQTLLLGILSLLISLGIVWYVWRQPPASGWLLYVALGILLGGALGNMSDRLLLGFVVDFLDLRWQGRNIWPVFNGADIAVDLGVVLLLLTAWRAPRDTPEARHA